MPLTIGDYAEQNRRLAVTMMRQQHEIGRLRERLSALGHDPDDGPRHPPGPPACPIPIEQCEHVVHCPLCGAGSCAPGDAENGYCGHCGYVSADTWSSTTEKASAVLEGDRTPTGAQPDPLTVRCCACLAPPGEACIGTTSDLPRERLHRLRPLTAAPRLVHCPDCEGSGWRETGRAVAASAVTCPVCGAAPRALCTEGGHGRARVHEVRVRAAHAGLEPCPSCEAVGWVPEPAPSGDLRERLAEALRRTCRIHQVTGECAACRRRLDAVLPVVAAEIWQLRDELVRRTREWKEEQDSRIAAEQATIAADQRAEAEADAGDVPACRVCGCTEDAACEGGCHWVPDPGGMGKLCNRCVGAVARVTVEDLETGERTVRGVPAGNYAIWATAPCSFKVAAFPGGFHQVLIRNVRDGQDDAGDGTSTTDPGDPQLAEHERAALTATAIGLTCDSASRRLRISARTIRRAQRTAVMRLGASSVVHAVALAAAAGQLDPALLQDRALPPWPAKGPLPGQLAINGRAQQRRAKFNRLRRGGMSVADAAEEVGVTEATGRKYQREMLRAAGEGGRHGRR